VKYNWSFNVFDKVFGMLLTVNMVAFIDWHDVLKNRKEVLAVRTSYIAI